MLVLFYHTNPTGKSSPACRSDPLHQHKMRFSTMMITSMINKQIRMMSTGLMLEVFLVFWNNYEYFTVLHSLKILIQFIRFTRNTSARQLFDFPPFFSSNPETKTSFRQIYSINNNCPNKTTIFFKINYQIKSLQKVLILSKGCKKVSKKSIFNAFKLHWTFFIQNFPLRI